MYSIYRLYDERINYYICTYIIILADGAHITATTVAHTAQQ